jgi:hypothetical protein
MASARVAIEGAGREGLERVSARRKWEKAPMRIERRYTKAELSSYAEVEFRLTKSEIRNPDGSVVFALDNIEVPASWSQVAADVLAQKYFRKAGVPAKLKKVEENSVPSFLWRSVPDEAAMAELPKQERYGSEISAKQVFDRLAGAWTYWGWKGKYFDGEAEARAFYDELRFMLARQMVAPNSPQWFNTGLYWAYGIDGPSQGHYYVDFESGKLVKSKSAYIRNRMPVSSNPSPTISSTRAALWISGCGKPGSSNMARAPAPISRNCVAKTKSCPAAASLPGSCLSSRSAIARLARSNPAARRAAPPKWSWSMPTIPISRPISIGR